LDLIAFTAVPVEIVTDPQSATQLVGGSVTFNCAASGTPPLTFMWYKDGESAALVAGESVSINNHVASFPELSPTFIPRPSRLCS